MSNVAIRQTDEQTNTAENKISFAKEIVMGRQQSTDRNIIDLHG